MEVSKVQQDPYVVTPQLKRLDLHLVKACIIACNYMVCGWVFRWQSWNPFTEDACSWKKTSASACKSWLNRIIRINWQVNSLQLTTWTHLPFDKNTICKALARYTKLWPERELNPWLLCLLLYLLSYWFMIYACTI